LQDSKGFHFSDLNADADHVFGKFSELFQLVRVTSKSLFGWFSDTTGDLFAKSASHPFLFPAWKSVFSMTAGIWWMHSVVFDPEDLPENGEFFDRRGVCRTQHVVAYNAGTKVRFCLQVIWIRVLPS